MAMKQLEKLSVGSKLGSPTKSKRKSTGKTKLKENTDACSDNVENSDIEKGSDYYELGELTIEKKEEEIIESDNGYFDLLPVSKNILSIQCIENACFATVYFHT